MTEYSLEIDGIPRRSQLNHLTPAELVIFQAMQEIEKLSPHPLLTEAVILLGQAKDRVADYVERDRQMEDVYHFMPLPDARRRIQEQYPELPFLAIQLASQEIGIEILTENSQKGILVNDFYKLQNFLANPETRKRLSSQTEG